MKKLIFLPFILFCFSNCFSQWVWQNPQPQGNDLKFVHFFNSQTGYALGNSTTFIKTTDSGNNWFNISTDTTNYKINSVFYLDSANWWATGVDWGIIIKTTNGGVNWSLISNIEYLQYTSIFFINHNTGYATGNWHIFKTTNSGLTWNIYLNVSSCNLNSIFFISATTGYSAGNGGTIFKTTNSGVNWILQNSNCTKNLFSIRFLNEQTGWAINTDSILVTTNGGNNWISRCPNLRVNSPYPPYTYVLTLTDFHFENSQTGWVSCCDFSYNYYINKTTNGGLNWSYIKINNTIRSIDFINSDTGTAVGDNGVIYKSSNGGTNWNIINKGKISGFYSVFFINPQTGWIAGGDYNDFVYKTTDGGNNWDTVIFVSHYFLHSIFFVNTQTGWVTGGSPGANGRVIMKSTNGGNDWALQLSGGSGSNFLFSTYFFDSQTGFVVGDEILKTTNGGNNWISSPLDTADNLRFQIQFINAQTGFIYGFEGVSKTTNQGINWSIIFRTGDCGFFINAQTGWVNSRFNINKTTNGGNNWTSQLSLSGNETFESIYFINLQTGFVTNNFGTIYKTTNSGLNWSMQRKTQYYLKSIFFADSLTGWIVGGGGTILKTTNGGNSTLITQINNSIPEKFSLSQNFPNPFNPSTNIKFQIKQSGLVQIRVFDLLGKEIETLVNEKMQPGNYEIQFNGNDLPSGVYFYRIQTNDFVEVKKMVLIK